MWANGVLTPAPHWSRDLLGVLLAACWRLLAACWRLQGPLPRGENWWLHQNPLILGTILHLGGGGMAWVAILAAPPPHSFSLIKWHLPYFLDAALLFVVNTAIMGWLLLAVQHYKQHPRHNDVFLIKFNCKFESLLNETNKVNEN